MLQSALYVCIFSLEIPRLSRTNLTDRASNDTPEQALPQKNVIYIYVKQANNRHIIISGFRASLMFITKKKNVFSASFHKLCHHCLT